MEVGRPLLRHQLGGTAADRHRVDQRRPLAVDRLRLIADRPQLAIVGDAVIVVDARQEPEIHRLRHLEAVGIRFRSRRLSLNLVEPAAGVEIQRVRSVGKPVRRFDAARLRDHVHHPAIPGAQADGFQGVDERWLLSGTSRRRPQFDVGERRGLDPRGGVRGHPQTDVELAGKVDAGGPAGRTQLLSIAGHGHRDVVPALLDANPLRADDVRLHFVRDAALVLAPLQRRQAVAVHGGVRVHRIRVQRLTDDEAGFAVRIRCPVAGMVPVNSMVAASVTSPDTFFQT